MNIFEKIRLQYRHIKTKMQNRKRWRYNFKRLSDYEYNLKITAKNLAEYEEKIKKAEYDVKKREDKIRYYEDVENYIMGWKIVNWIKKKIIPNLVIAIFITKTKRLKILLKRVENYTLKDDGKEYKINPEFFLRGKKYFIAFFLEDKLEQINPNYLDACPISATNFAKIFDDTLISKVFSPKDAKDSKIAWVIFVIIGIIVLLLILHFAGVIDLKEILNFSGQAAQNATANMTVAKR